MTPAGGGLDPVSWRVWWAYNHDAYLSLAERVVLADRTASEYGEGRAGLVAAFREHALPVFRQLLVEGDAADVLRESLLTLGRVGDEPELRDVPDLDFYARHFLGQNSGVMRSAALLTLGVSANPHHVSLLRALLLDEPEGRAVVRESAVGERTRAMAAYALGLLARSNSSQGTKLSLAADLLQVLEEGTPELCVAAALALGLVDIEACNGSDVFELDGRHVCRETVLEALSTRAFDPAARPALRAHCVTSIGRLGAGANAPDLRATAARVLLELASTSGDPGVQQSALLALGPLTGTVDGELQGEVRTKLEELVHTGEPPIQRLALLALAQAAGRAALAGPVQREAQVYLMQELARGKRVLRPWAALALGVLGHDLLAAGQDHEELVFALHRSLQGTNDPEEAAAAALALGILRDGDPGSQTVLQKDYQHFQDLRFRESAMLGLGLMHAQAAHELLRERFEGGDAQAAVALELLGDQELGPQLRKRLKGEPSAEMVRALSLRAEPETVAALAGLLADKGNPSRARAAAAAGLGDLLDLDAPHWSAAYANGLNYFALTSSIAGSEGRGALLDSRPWQ